MSRRELAKRVAVYGSVAAFAKAAGVGRVSVYTWLKGLHVVSAKMAARIRGEPPPPPPLQPPPPAERIVDALVAPFLVRLPWDQEAAR